MRKVYFLSTAIIVDEFYYSNNNNQSVIDSNITFIVVVVVVLVNRYKCIIIYIIYNAVEYCIVESTLKEYITTWLA